MGGWCTFAHAGSFIVSQCRYAFRRHSSSHSGSPFLAEIRRITSSLSPTGTVSDSMSVTKPALYSRAAMSLAVMASELIAGETSNPNLLNLYEIVKDGIAPNFRTNQSTTSIVVSTRHVPRPGVQNIDSLDDIGRAPRRGGGGRSRPILVHPPRVRADHR